MPQNLKKITTLEGERVKTFEHLKDEVSRSWFVRFSGLQTSILFFLQSYEAWQDFRNKTFSDLSHGRIDRYAAEIERLKDELKEANAVIDRLVKEGD